MTAAEEDGGRQRPFHASVGALTYNMDQDPIDTLSMQKAKSSADLVDNGASSPPVSPLRTSSSVTKLPHQTGHMEGAEESGNVLGPSVRVVKKKPLPVDAPSEGVERPTRGRRGSMYEAIKPPPSFSHTKSPASSTSSRTSTPTRLGKAESTDLKSKSKDKKE